MFEPIRSWLSRYISDPQILFLLVTMITATLVIILAGSILMPVIAALILAYVLDGPVARLEKMGLPRLFGAWIMLLGYIFFVALLIAVLIPLLYGQTIQLLQQLPSMINKIQQWMMALPERYPTLISQSEIEMWMKDMSSSLLQVRQQILSRSVSLGVSLFSMVVYIFLVPVLLFFLLKDKKHIIAWCRVYLPDNHSLTIRVMEEVDIQVANYVRGKAVEIIIVASVSLVTFALLDLNYSLLLAAMVGLSVLIPFVGAFVITLPVALVALSQWGFGWDFILVVGIYTIIQILDGNILVPIVFSETMNLHPVAIIIAVLFFSGIWGFWGLFFSIPLATVVQSVLKALNADKRAALLSPAEPNR